MSDQTVMWGAFGLLVATHFSLGDIFGVMAISILASTLLSKSRSPNYPSDRWCPDKYRN